MTWLTWLTIAVLIAAVAAITGLKPKGTKPVARTQLMGARCPLSTCPSRRLFRFRLAFVRP
jgi:hypothetical protein